MKCQIYVLIYLGYKDDKEEQRGCWPRATGPQGTKAACLQVKDGTEIQCYHFQSQEASKNDT